MSGMLLLQDLTIKSLQGYRLIKRLLCSNGANGIVTAPCTSQCCDITRLKFHNSWETLILSTAVSTAASTATDTN